MQADKTCNYEEYGASSGREILKNGILEDDGQIVRGKKSFVPNCDHCLTLTK